MLYIIFSLFLACLSFKIFFLLPFFLFFTALGSSAFVKQQSRVVFESTNFKFSVVHCNTVYVLSFHSFILIKIYEKITL